MGVVAFVLSCNAVHQMQQILLQYLERLREATTNLFCIFFSNNLIYYFLLTIIRTRGFTFFVSIVLVKGESLEDW